jgi:hypothetical protein
MLFEKEQKFSLTKLLAWFRNCEPAGGSAQAGIISRDALCNRLLPTVKSAAVVRCFAGGGFFLGARAPTHLCLHPAPCTLYPIHTAKWNKVKR